MRKLFAVLAVALVATGCNDSGNGGNPTDPSQVNIEFAFTDLTVGSGPEAVAGNAVTVNYTGWLYNAAGAASKGTQFDTSLQAGRTPYPVLLGARQVIPGFEQAIVGMRVGGKRRAYIPASLAYGSSGSSDGRIPPNAALVFEIDLVTLVQ